MSDRNDEVVGGNGGAEMLTTARRLGAGAPPPPRAYAKPQLTPYGRLADVTRVMGGVSGANDKIKTGNKTGLP